MSSINTPRSGSRSHGPAISARWAIIGLIVLAAIVVAVVLLLTTGGGGGGGGGGGY